MTLILGTLAAEYTILVGDRRITRRSGNNTEIVREDCDKVLMSIRLQDAVVSIGFSGLAIVPQPHGFDTSAWLPKALMSAMQPDHKLIPTLYRLLDITTREFRVNPAIKKCSPADARLVIAIVGYLQQDDGSWSPFERQLSNFHRRPNPSQTWLSMSLRLSRARS